jgi:class III poly(R)-hydroxyalkanoic acid synthase PhaE subunit
MNDDQQGSQQSTDVLTSLLNSASEFYGGLMKSWTDTMAGAAAKVDPQRGGWNRTRDSVESVLKTWQSLSTAAADPSVFSAASNLGQSMPDIMFRIMQASWQGAFNVQRDWLERAGRIGKSAGSYSLENLDVDAFRAWTEIYEKEFKQFFHVPQLGLTRFYQEKYNHALDKFNRLQSQFGEFMVIFFAPMEKAMRLLQEDLAKRVDAGELSGDYNAHYRQWVKILEGQYMRLFATEDFKTKLVETLNALNEFLVARDAVIEDALKSVSVPTQHELDEVYKELYILKKRVRALEKGRPTAPAGSDGSNVAKESP